MSAVSTFRAFRPSAVALVAVLVALLLAPLAMQPPAARAVNLPDLNPCHLGDLSQKACDGAEDVAGGVIDGVEWIGDGVGKIAGGVWKASKPFLKAAAVAGLAVGVPILCSKAGKALAAATAATAAGVGTAGTGSAPAAAATLAGTAAVCTLLKKGSKLALKIVAKNSGKLGKLAKLAAGATGLAALTLGTQHAAAWILQNALDVTAPSAPNLGSSWVADLRSNLNGLAGALLIVAAIVGLMFAAFSGRISEVGRILSGMIGAALVIGIVGSLLFTAVQLSDEVTAGTVQSKWGQQALGNWTDLGDSYADASPVKEEDGGAGEDAENASDDTAAETEKAGQGTPPDDGKGPWILRFLIAIVTVFAGALVWLELQIRNALLELLLVFSGLMLAGYAFEKLRHLATSFALTLLGVVVAKPILVVTLLLGGAQMQNAAKTWAILPLLTGAGLMLLAGLLGAKVISWMGFQGSLVEKGAMRLRSMNGGGLRSAGGHGSERQPSGERSEGAPGTPDATDVAPAARQMTRAAAERATADAAAGAAAGSTGPGARSGMVGGAAAAVLDDTQRASAPTPAPASELGVDDDAAASLEAGHDAADDTSAAAGTSDLQSRATGSDDAARPTDADPSDAAATADMDTAARGRDGEEDVSALEGARERSDDTGQDLDPAPAPVASAASAGALEDGAPPRGRDDAAASGSLADASMPGHVGGAAPAGGGAAGVPVPPSASGPVGASPASGGESARPVIGATSGAVGPAPTRAEPGVPPAGMTGDHADAIGDQAARAGALVAAAHAAQPAKGDSDER